MWGSRQARNPNDTPCRAITLDPARRRTTGRMAKPLRGLAVNQARTLNHLDQPHGAPAADLIEGE
jgi:hypothetical protein